MKENTKLNVYTQSQTDLSLDQGTHLEILSSVDPSSVTSVTEFEAQGLRDKIKQLFSFSRNKIKLSVSQKLYIFENIALLLDSGIAIDETFNILQKQSQDKKIKFVLEICLSSIKKGKKLSDILKSFQSCFDSKEIGMISAGESIGKLTSSLNQLSNDLKFQLELKNEVKKASMYPIMVMIFTLLVVVAMLKFVIPQVSALFVSSDMELPAVTQVIISISNFLNDNFILFSSYILLIVVLISSFLKTSMGKRIYDFLLLNLPFVKDIQQLKNQSLFAQTLGSLMLNGVSIVRSLEITRDSTANFYLKNYIFYLLEDVKSGIKLYDAMFLSPYFSDFFISQLAVGEKSSNLPQVALKVASNNHKNLSDKLQNFTKLLQPVVMLVLGGVVGTVVLAIMLPLSQMISNINVF
ncbi:hypothetical protein CL656_00845 [bacterium]|nr:hypothetical protein [bacterium]|tara:strand:+ start:719 stop:1945 length:1227 start_codon:yes stop_codon:yes gene_type:complete